MQFLRRKRSGGRTSRSPQGAPESKHGDISCSPSKGPRLERHNAMRHIDYDLVASTARTSWSFSSSSASSQSEDAHGATRTSQSLDLPYYGRQMSFRISGDSGEREIHEMCRSLGLSGPEDFSISLSEWEARKSQMTSEALRSSRSKSDSVNPSIDDIGTQGMVLQSATEQKDEMDAEGDEGQVNDELLSPEIRGENRGIIEVRPAGLVSQQQVTFNSFISPNLNKKTSPLLLRPPPVMYYSSALDREGSAWEVVDSSASIEEAELCESVKSDDDDMIPTAEVIGDMSEVIEKLMELRPGETIEGFTRVSPYSTMNDDDSSSTTTEAPVSPKGLSKMNIKSWSRGKILGAGSYGTVYEVFSEEGAFFAVKEVSLLDQGSNAQPCIDQLEQEIALLSQLEHENIVKYYGTDKEDTKLFIFLELVTKGSLASLYQNYHLQDSHVSAYTRQILNGLKYLHDRNVVHRDIKCANILVHANGSVKLADFGLAKEMTELNALKSCKGSVYWMAPEVVNHKKTYGKSADIWSLGCTVLEMLTRQVPYPNVEWTQALYKIGHGEQPPIPSYLSRDASDFIKQCVRVNPNDRPTAAELLDHPFVKR